MTAAQINDAFERAWRRIAAASPLEETTDDGWRHVVGERPSNAFANTDLPAVLVLHALSRLIEWQEDRWEAKGGVSRDDLQGLVLAAFLFGWESRS